MKILYGICGEGMGHATRSLVALEHLRRRGHELLVAASGQALRVLRSQTSPRVAVVEPPPSAAAALGDASSSVGVNDVLPIVGLGMRCRDGALDLRGTIEENAQRLPKMLRENAGAWAAAERFQPDAAITDYDSFVWLFAAAHHVPVVSIDNAQVLPRCLHRRDIFRQHDGGMRALEAFTVAKTPAAHHFIVTTFFYPPVKPHLGATTSLVPPILRGEVLRALDAQRPPAGDHVLVYKTGSLDDASVLAPLARVPEQRFHVYGLGGDAVPPPNAIAKPFDADGFLADLAASRAVVGNGGMSLIGEALAFQKPIYAIPVRGQFEQVLNACYLEQLGYGTTSEVLDPDRLRAFLRDAAVHAAAIGRVPQHDRNERLHVALDGLFPPVRA